MKNETPSALIKGAIRGALRSGRYANRSITTPRKPVPSIDTMNITTISSQTEIDSPAGPPNAVITP
jgi:hypothetical protein